MPHTLNIDGVSECLFQLQMLVHSSKSFCAKHRISYEDDGDAEFDWNYYFGWLKSSVCEKLILSAITLRMMQDILTADDNQEPAYLQRCDAEAISGIQLGAVHEGSVNLTLREACNKIIHATDTQLDWNEEADFQWWTGNVWLFGSNRGNDWKLQLNAEAFVVAATRYVDSVSDGVDWYHVYKYDT